MKNNPLVSFVLYAYNEEEFIREAVESALAQDYSPLEIVLSDDGSTDRTFSIMQEMAAAYHGPHKIILNQNETNIGIGSQINAAVQKTKGELILLANGDDISLPDRTQVTVNAWLEGDRAIHAIHSDLECINKEGRDLAKKIHTRCEFNSLEQGMLNRFGGVRAASLALSRRVFDAFGTLPDNLILEDNPLFMRAFILGDGKAFHIETPLVRYRVHKENISQSYAVGEFDEWRERNKMKAVWHKQEGVKAYLQMLRDLHQLPSTSWPEADLKRARWAGMEKVLENEILYSYYANDSLVSLSTRWKTLIRLSIILLKIHFKRIFPFIEHRNEKWHYKRVCEAEGRID